MLPHLQLSVSNILALALKYNSQLSRGDTFSFREQVLEILEKLIEEIQEIQEIPPKEDRE